MGAILFLMARYTQVILLLGIYLPLNQAVIEWICASSPSQVRQQCESTGGQCLESPNCGGNWLHPLRIDDIKERFGDDCCCTCIPNSNPTDCFEDDKLFVEDSFALNSVQDCSDACKATSCCEFFTWSTTALTCGLRCFHPNNLINAPTQQTGRKGYSGIQSNKVWVGKAISNISDKFQCQVKCRQDHRCKSVTFNGPNSPNPNTCVLNYGPTIRKLSIPANSGIASAPKYC